MNPEQPVVNAHEAKHLRLIITSGLALLFVAIVATYVFFGMQVAKKEVVVPVDVNTTPETPAAQQIFEALETTPQTADEATINAVGQALETASKDPTADPEAVRNALE